ncbi:hypothetical protein J0B03_10810 [Alkalibacter rhizosphaerae]|uniref:Uncharacterized protein n=1 Tax=Alkalibacter rhizosphaerae TaxID=2815577 RepID=A0A974XLQ3_9FIRM|nr:hypothetical protein [Alkalibacter rhizosphaerae]QSX08266.1 hypothetical protein J0B03_10810 [Alkalibacter rhizosphaerae]
MKLKFGNETVIVYDDKYEVHIQKKIFGGFTLKKYLIDSIFDLLESRDIRVDISQEEAIQMGKELLSREYKSTGFSFDFNNPLAT